MSKRANLRVRDPADPLTKASNAEDLYLLQMTCDESAFTSETNDALIEAIQLLSAKAEANEKYWAAHGLVDQLRKTLSMYRD